MHFKGEPQSLMRMCDVCLFARLTQKNAWNATDISISICVSLLNTLVKITFWYFPLLFYRRKLTSSQITISTKTSQGEYAKKQGVDYADPEATPENPEDLYQQHAAGQHTEAIYETFDDVRRQTLNLETEGNIYGYRNGGSKGDLQEPLYVTRDHVAYEARDQHVATREVPMSQPQEIAQDTHDITFAQPNVQEQTFEDQHNVYDPRGQHGETDFDDQYQDYDMKYNSYDQYADSLGMSFQQGGEEEFTENDFSHVDQHNQDMSSLNNSFQYHQEAESEYESTYGQPNQNIHPMNISLQIQDEDGNDVTYGQYWQHTIAIPSNTRSENADTWMNNVCFT